jgi:glutathione S-transferase
MSLTLHFHPLSSFCHKALIALYENDTPFERKIVNLMDPAEAAAFRKLWPCGQFPVLVDDGRVIAESTVIIEHLDARRPGKTRLIPADPELARQVREKDRFYDWHLHIHMQKVVGDRLRPADKKDPYGVEVARNRIMVALGMVDAEMAGRTWAVGDSFSMADCAAGPPLFYIDRLFPLAEQHRNAAAYLQRLTGRPSYARALEEAQPYFKMLPF